MNRRIVETRCCVIGGAGFLGSHLVEHLLFDRHCQVLVLDNLISGLRRHVPDGADFVWHDIRYDEVELVRLLLQYQIEYVFNYAAEPYVPECFERPLHFFDINAVAALRVLNACHKAGVQAILQVSSAEIYGDAVGKIKETDPIVPHSTYGVSKVAADGLVQVRWREAGVPALALRQFNCVGERETHEYVIPEIISQIHTQAVPNPTVRLGNNSERDFLYAGDAVRLAVELLEKGQFGEVYNLGSEDTIHIYDLAEMIGHVMACRSVTIEPDSARVRPWEIWHLQSDNSKIYHCIEGRPEVSLVSALERTVDFFQHNGSRWDW